MISAYDDPLTGRYAGTMSVRGIGFLVDNSVLPQL